MNAQGWADRQVDFGLFCYFHVSKFPWMWEMRGKNKQSLGEFSHSEPIHVTLYVSSASRKIHTTLAWGRWNLTFFLMVFENHITHSRVKLKKKTIKLKGKCGTYVHAYAVFPRDTMVWDCCFCWLSSVKTKDSFLDINKTTQIYMLSPKFSLLVNSR